MSSDQPDPDRTQVDMSATSSKSQSGNTASRHSEPDKSSTPEIAWDQAGSPIQSFDPDVIRASSTPKADVEFPSRDEISGEIIHSGASSRRSRQNSVLRDDELSPLLDSECSEAYAALEEGLQEQLRRTDRPGESRGWPGQRFYLNMWCASIAFALILVIILISVMVFLNLPMLLDEALTSEIGSISVTDINDSSLTVHVAGSTYIDYERISRPIYGLFLKSISIFIGAVAVAPKGVSKIYLSGEGIERGHALDVSIPEVLVDLVDHRLTEYNFDVGASFDEASVSRLLQEFMDQDRSKPLPVKVEVEFLPVIRKNWLRFTPGRVRLENDVFISSDNLTSLISVEDIKIDARYNSINVYAIMLIDTLPVKLSFKAIQWDVSIADCSEEPSFLGVWDSYPFEVVPDKMSEVLVEGSIDKIPPYLLEACDDYQSPFNKFISKITNEGILDIYLSAADTERNAESLPKWLFNILSSTKFHLVLPIRSPNAISLHDKISDIEINSLDLNFPSASSENYFVELACDASAVFQLPGQLEGFEVRLSNWTSSVSFRDNHTCLGSASTIASSVVSIGAGEPNGTAVSAKMDSWMFHLFDHQSLGQLMNNWINGYDLGRLPAVDVDVDSVDLQSAIFNTTLRGLQVHDIEWEKISSEELAISRNDTLNWLLKEMNISISTLQLAASGANFADFKVEFEIFNPLPISMRLNSEQLVFAFIHEGVDIGTVTIDSLVLSQGTERNKIPTYVHITCPTFKERNAAEKFASLILSGSRNATVGVKGIASDPNSVFGKVMEWIHVPHIHVPHLSFPLPEEDVAKPKQELTQSSPFLLEVTIHVFTSEVELLVFNPISNQGLRVNILSCQAIYEEKVLAYTDNVGTIIVPPGIYRTKKIPYKVGSGVSSDILQRALNGELDVIVKADMLVTLGRFTAQILLQIDGVSAKVRL